MESRLKIRARRPAYIVWAKSREPCTFPIPFNYLIYGVIYYCSLDLHYFHVHVYPKARDNGGRLQIFRKRLYSSAGSTRHHFWPNFNGNNFFLCLLQVVTPHYKLSVYVVRLGTNPVALPILRNLIPPLYLLHSSFSTAGDIHQPGSFVW